MAELPDALVFWGGHAGFFSDQDGNFWNVAWGAFDFREVGSLIVP